MIDQSISVVTTFHKEGLDKYGQKMLDSFAEMWPKEITLYAYAEDCTPVVPASNIIVKDLHASSPELVAFKNKWKDVPKQTAMYHKIQYVVYVEMQAKVSNGTL